MGISFVLVLNLHVLLMSGNVQMGSVLMLIMNVMGLMTLVQQAGEMIAKTVLMRTSLPVVQHLVVPTQEERETLLASVE